MFVIWPKSSTTLRLLALLICPLARAQQEYRLPDPDFERGGASAWSVAGGVRARGGPQERVAYFGRHALGLDRGAVRLELRLPVDGAADTPSVGQCPEVGMWVALEGAGAPSARARFDLRVDARDPRSGRWLPLARRRWSAGSREADRWHFLLTESIGPPPGRRIPVGCSSIRIVLQKRGDAARLDWVEAAPRGLVDGLPSRLALASYAGWYRSPLSDQSTGTGSTPKQRWENWAWTDPPACDPTDSSLIHDPNCPTNPQCFRSNGRRDAATSVIDGLDQLPLAGTYDSRDPDLLRYHVRVAQAVGIDALVFDWYGQRLAEQSGLAGEEPIGIGALRSLLDEAEASTQDLKVSIMYEPKVHMFGWVQGEPTFADKKAGIVHDLVWLLQTHGGRRALLRRRGDPVLFVFDHEVCMAGGECLDDDDWADVSAAVEAATGESLVLVSTHPPDAAQTPFTGSMRWGLVAEPILRFSSWSDFQIGREKIPPATALDVFDHACLINGIAESWAALVPDRFAVATVWPGFDDSGVAGWSSVHGMGSDGGDLCLRVAHDPGGAFLTATLSAALESRSDWLQLCTFNDWNEGTAIEPAWNADFVADVAAGRASDEATLDAVFRRAFETQAGLIAYLAPRSQGLNAQAIEEATREYIEATLNGDATAYD